MNMLFTNTKGYPPGVIQQNRNTNISSMNYYNVNVYKHLTPQPQQQVQKVQVNNEEEEHKQKPMKWGEPIWFFFHTIAEKVKNESFPYVKQDLLNIIYKVCVNLPCPMCANHAVEYMNKINFNAIQTKDQLKDVLFVFHNSVNVRKNFPVFMRKDLDEKYSRANTIKIIQNFLNVFQYKNSNMHMIANNMHRTNVANDIKGWFNTNIQHFHY